MNTRVKLEDEKNSGEGNKILDFDNFLPKFLIKDLDNLDLDQDSDCKEDESTVLPEEGGQKVTIRDRLANQYSQGMNFDFSSPVNKGKDFQPSGNFYSDFGSTKVS